MKKVFKVVAIVLAVIIVLVVILIVKNHITSLMPIISDDYYTKFESSSVLEKKYAGLGEYEVSNESYDTDESAIKKYRVWYPTNMEEGTEKYPLIVVANASNTAALNYEAWFKRLASWGFIVAGNEDRGSGNGESTSKTLDYLLKLNADKESKFFSKIDLANIGAVGYSQGGAAAIRAVTKFENSHMYKTLFTGSAAYPLLAKNMGWEYDASEIKISYFMNASTGKSDDTGSDIYDENNYAGVCPLQSLNVNYNAMSDDITKVLGRIKNAEHEDMLVKSDGYMTAWMLFQLKNDTDAEKVFVGENAEFLTNTNWQDLKKNI